jgi:polysaccharide export outer membrane protein
MKKGVGFAVGLLLLAAMPLLSAQEASVKPVATLSSSDATPDSSSQPATPQLQQRDSRYRLAAGDFNQTVVVQPDGYVTLKAVGDVQVVGQTVPELTQTLRTAYGKMLNDPLVVVVLKDFEKPYFIADGQVGHPGKYDMRGTVTLTEAVAIAGGFTENAKHSQVLLFRRVNDQWLSAKIFNIKDMQKKGDLHEDPTLRPGDMVIVPKNVISKIKPFIPSSGVGGYTQIGR